MAPLGFRKFGGLLGRPRAKSRPWRAALPPGREQGLRPLIVVFGDLGHHHR